MLRNFKVSKDCYRIHDIIRMILFKKSIRIIVAKWWKKEIEDVVFVYSLICSYMLAKSICIIVFHRLNCLHMSLIVSRRWLQYILQKGKDILLDAKQLWVNICHLTAYT